MEVRYVTDRHDTLCAKYRQEYRDNPDYLYCGVADMDLAPPDPVLEAMKRRLDHGVLVIPNCRTVMRNWFQTGCVSGITVR